MFGEPLPQRFFELQLADTAACDLLLVIGTSLVVYPVAGITKLVGSVVPRLLLNDKLTGPFQALADRGEPNSDPGSTSNFRDAAFVGDCDDGVLQLCDALGWRDELEA